ncbi:MAG: ATP-dependent RecD-like DNA helicase [Myxococcales bacterium]|nr:ATP-dependent RecD-like DNA helicase [Myxococcales bacterium]MDH3486260.1 ATP-dependent RecD-like DNA helicase [Myxococcales bacterium]
MGSNSREEVVEGVVEDVLFRSDDGRFTVIRLLLGDGDPSTSRPTAVGDLGQIAPGENVRLVGRWTQHAVYGPRFRVTSFTPTIPSTELGMVRYLGSGLIPGIGPALAARLVKRFGQDTLDVIATQSARLREVPGIGSQRAQSIAQAVRQRRVEAETMSFLHALGMGPATARDIVRKYGADAPRIVRDDPYIVAEQIRGIGFRTADRIAEALGIAGDDIRRVQGGVLHLVGKAVDEGHVFATRQQLHDGLGQLDVPQDSLDEALLQLRARDLVVVEDDAVYPPLLYRAERLVAEALAGLAKRPKIKQPLKTHDENLTDTQRSAVEASLGTHLLVMTGGPGTGKTTTVRAIVQAHEALERRVALCAPTGRAAKRLSDAAGTEAKTIHRLLEWNPATGRFNRDQRMPLDAELILVDEASMLDMRLASQLLAAIPVSATLVLVGDVDQLPPIGPGQPLRDLIASEICTTIRLHEVFRQAQQSAIVRGAHAVLQGSMPEPTPTGTRGDGDLFLIPATDPDTIADRLVQALKRMSVAYGFDPLADVQVVTPMRRGPLGTYKLNEVLQEAFNPETRDTVTPMAFRPGDKVMQLRNDYDKEVYNGDLGEVRRIEGGITYVLFDGREVQYKADELDAITLAYACTVHKVQGSEFPAAVIVLHNAHFVLLNRALLYTALTRAKQLVVLVGDPKAMARAARNALTYETNSKLLDRLRTLV